MASSYPPELPAEAVAGQPRIFLDTLPDVSTPGHVIHDAKPALYRRHVGEFLQRLT